MIDHVYNLLRLRPSTYDPGDFPAPRPPAGFSPPRLGPGLTAVRAVLFGADPDPWYLESRMRQYMVLLHEGAFADHVASYDPRITYLPLLRAPRAPTGVASTPRRQSDPLPIAGVVAADDDRGTSRFLWDVAVAAGTGRRGNLAWSPLLPPPFVFDAAEPTGRLLSARRIAPTGGGPAVAAVNLGGAARRGNLVWSPLLPPPFVFDAAEPGDEIPGDPAAVTAMRLPGSDLTISAPTTAPAGDAWTVEARVAPGRGLAAVLVGLSALGEGPLRDLFGNRDGEPFATHRNLFRDHDQLPERLTGALLALVRRTHEALGLPT